MTADRGAVQKHKAVLLVKSAPALLVEQKNLVENRYIVELFWLVLDKI